MLYLLKLALRNVRRNRRRSLLAIVSMALALMLIVCMQGWIGGLMGSIVRNYTKNETGHVRIATTRFEERRQFVPVTHTVRNPAAIIAAISADTLLAPRLALVTERITFGVLVGRDSNSTAAMAMAGDPENEKNLLMMQKSIAAGGRYLDGRRQVVMGQALAKRLGLQVGDTARIVASGSDYALHLKKCVLVGVFSTGVATLDEGLIQLPLADGRELLGMGNATQQILVMLRDYRQAGQAAARIRALIPDTSIAVTPWDRIGDYGQIVLMGQKIYGLIFMFVALLGAFIISNIMMMVVLERRPEIGMLKSMGMKRGEILTLFLSEGVILGLAGTLVGAAIGATIVFIVHTTGIDIGSLTRSAKIPMDSVIYPPFSIANLVQAVVIGTLMAAFVSLFPSRRAARMNAIDAIKSV